MNLENIQNEFPKQDPRPEIREITPPQLNHIGISCSSKEEYDAAVKVLTSLGLVPQERPAPDHQRIFFKIPAGTEIEFQLWPEPGNFRAHFDLITSDPMTTLESFGPAEDWGKGEIPRGGVKIADHLMVMARPPLK